MGSELERQNGAPMDRGKSEEEEDSVHRIMDFLCTAVVEKLRVAQLGKKSEGSLQRSHRWDTLLGNNGN
jgi:hypothetical protein